MSAPTVPRSTGRTLVDGFMGVDGDDLLVWSHRDGAVTLTVAGCSVELSPSTAARVQDAIAEARYRR